MTCHNLGTEVKGSFQKGLLGSQHPSPTAKNSCNFETQIWLEIITSRDAKMLVSKAPRRHVQKSFLACFAENWQRKITSRDGCMLLIFSLEESLEFLTSLTSQESRENGRIVLCLPHSGGYP